MNPFVAAYLAQDGLANGAIYCLLAIALVLVFAVTRVIFIPQGEYVSYAALGYAALRDGAVSGTVGFLLSLLAVATLIDLARGAGRRVIRPALAPLVISALVMLSARLHLPALVDAVLTVATIAAIGPLMYRIVYRRLASASALVLLVVAVANHLVMLGLGLLFFGPGGVRAAPMIDAAFQIGGVPVQAQTLIIVLACLVLLLVLFLLAERTAYGRALRAAAINPLGARLMGISAQMAGETAFMIAAFIGGLSGVLISPAATLYYDSGFLLGLKGFVAGILGGLASFPLAGAGAFGLGLLESYTSFYASGFRDVIVFSLIIPILLWRSLAASRH